MRSFILLLALCAAAAACDQATIPTLAGAGTGGGSESGGGGGSSGQSLLISPSQVEIGVAGSIQLTTNFSGGTVHWSSNNPGVASVSAFGLVTGLSAGVATITARAATDTSRVGYATVVVSR